MKKNDLIEKIDAVLHSIANNKEGILFDEIFDKVNAQNILIDKDELSSSLKKLGEEGYIVIETIVRNGNAWRGYRPTFDGLVFSAQLGYTAIEWERKRDWDMARSLEKNQMDMQKNQTDMLKAQVDMMLEQTKIQKSVRKLTGWIAVGTVIAAIYYIVQVVDYIVRLFYPHHGV